MLNCPSSIDTFMKCPRPARLPPAHARVVDPQLRDSADAQVLEHDVGAFGEAQEDRAALGVLQIDRDALLVPIEVDDVRRLAAVERRTPSPRDLAVNRNKKRDWKTTGLNPSTIPFS